MDNKVILTAVIVIAAVVLVGGVAYALIGHGDDSVVTYDANGGKSGDRTTWTDTNDTVPIYIVVRDGYKFIEWNTSADGSGKTYNAGDHVDMGTYLYAIWGPPTVAFDLAFVPNFDFYLGSTDAGAAAPVKVVSTQEYNIPHNPMFRVYSQGAAESIAIDDDSIVFTFIDRVETIEFAGLFYSIDSMTAVGSDYAEVCFTVPYSSATISVSHSHTQR